MNTASYNINEGLSCNVEDDSGRTFHAPGVGNLCQC